MFPVTITLTWAEMMLAHAVAGHRIIMNLRGGASAKFGAPLGVEGDALHVLSCRAEMATAKYFNRFWSGAVGDYSAADIGKDIEVRSTSPGDRRSLILHKQDHDERAYILVIAEGRAMTLTGWIRGRDGKRDQWWSDPIGGRPAYFVPQTALCLEEIK
jgi:hypothetical protein